MGRKTIHHAGRNLLFFSLSHQFSSDGGRQAGRQAAHIGRTTAPDVPDQPYRNSRSSKSVDQRTLCSSETSINGFWGSLLGKGTVGSSILKPIFPLFFLQDRLIGYQAEIVLGACSRSSIFLLFFFFAPYYPTGRVDFTTAWSDETTEKNLN